MIHIVERIERRLVAVVMVIPPVAGVVVVEIVAVAQIRRHGLGQLSQHFFRNAQGNAHHQQLVPQDQVAGDGLLQARKVLEPMLERLAASRHLGALRRVATEGAAQDKAHDRDGDRDHSGADIGIRKVGIDQRAQNAKDDDDAENQAGNQGDGAIRCDKLARLQLALNRALIVLELVANRCGALASVLLQLAKRARTDSVLIGLNAGEEDLEHIAIDAVLLGSLPGLVGHCDAIRLLLFFATEQTLLLGLGRFFQLDHAVVGQLHQRGDICLIGHVVPAHKSCKHRGMIGGGHIAEVLVLEERLGLGPAQLEHHDYTGIGNRHNNTHHGNRAGNRTRVLTAGVSFVGPFLLFAQDR